MDKLGGEAEEYKVFYRAEEDRSFLKNIKNKNSLIDWTYIKAQQTNQKSHIRKDIGEKL